MKLNFDQTSTQSAQALSNAALALMQEYGVSPQPNNYLLWFVHALGQEVELFQRD